MDDELGDELVGVLGTGALQEQVADHWTRLRAAVSRPRQQVRGTGAPMADAQERLLRERRHTFGVLAEHRERKHLVGGGRGQLLLGHLHARMVERGHLATPASTRDRARAGGAMKR